VVLPSVGSGGIGLEAPRGTSVMGHNPLGLDRLHIRPASGGPGRRRHHGRQLV